MTPLFQQLKGIIFDYGGTLDTNARHWAHVLWEGYRHASLPVTEAQFREAYVTGERTLAKHPIVMPDDDFLQLLRKKLDEETKALVASGYWAPNEKERKAKGEEVAAYCYVYARRTTAESRITLQLLSDHFPLVLVSNFYGNINAILKDFGLAPFFQSVIESAVVGIRKPDPAIFSMGVEALGLQPEEVLVVGDSYGKDIVPAKKIGCKAIWMKGEGWTQEDVDESLPDALITSLDELNQMY